MRSTEYRQAVAECLREAAAKGLIERHYRVGRRNILQDATSTATACYLVDKLTESDFIEPRLWIAVEPLQPELGLCISELRWMLHVEPRVEKGMKLLDLLWHRAAEPAELPEVAPVRR